MLSLRIFDLAHLSILCTNCLFCATHAAAARSSPLGLSHFLIKAAVKHRCPYYYVLGDVMHDRACSTPLPTISSIIPLKILDGDDSRADEVDDNKPIEVDTPRLKRAIGGLPTLKKKLRTLPSSL